jgi:hypothetical protein
MRSYQPLLDAGLHPETANRAYSESIDPAQVMAIINEMLTIFTSGGAGIVQSIMDLIGLFGVPMGKATTVPPDKAITRQQLLLAGLDEKLLIKAEAMAVSPTDILGWITTIFNVITVAGPALLGAIAAILNAFVTPPAPAPTTTGRSREAASKPKDDDGDDEDKNPAVRSHHKSVADGGVG